MRVNGTSIYCEEMGRGFPIVFVSGGGVLDRRGWDEQFREFARNYRAIRYDIRGIGKSARPNAPFSHSSDLHALLSKLKINRLHLVGMSVGAAIAIDFALAHPNMVNHLILAAPGLSSDALSDENLKSLTAITDLVKSEGMEQLIELTLAQPFVLSKSNLAGRQKVRRIYLDNRDVFESGFPLYRSWQPAHLLPENKLSEIQAHVLIVRGDKDSPTYSKMTDRIAEGLPTATTVVINGGTHFLNLEKPSEFNRVVLEFLRER